ncbi:YopX family protein [Bacillus sp. AG4(2022)]|uniref:YopX family protein n=1 Tax=Bacillus sp. AG4(2022) TaxID=2962594 RepID=UPI0028810E7D|nr:YopX family protein [Bacillus sp. AG4(2022)]MDT0163839.1 YopX family protein [Bacillus sp. AG4(2022)]
MREIKFRAWNSANNRFITDGDVYITQNGLVFGGDLGNPPLVDITNYDVVINQYTGLKDAKGVEIFEGDIVDVSYMSFEEFRGVVNFGEYKQDGSGGEYSASECIGFYVKVLNPDLEDESGPIIIWDHQKESSLLEYDRVEIIGNIYENPELLEAT